MKGNAMKSMINNTLKNNEQGYAMVVTMLVLLMMTIIGIAATNTSNIEVQISGNTKRISENFYDAEGGMINTLENTALWLTDSFFLAGETGAFFTSNIDYDNADGDNDNDTNPDAFVEIRCITTATDGGGDPIVISGLSAMANDLPVDRHLTPPPTDSGFSVVNFNVRKYGVTSTAVNGGAPLQTGVWKAFNKQ